MRKLFFIFIFLSANDFVFSQIRVLPDSLIGCYTGLSYFKYDEDSVWTIHNDTTYVTAVDTNNCAYYYGGWVGFATDSFGYCNAWLPCNTCTVFYPGDSLIWIYNHITQPPPNIHYFSTRQYLKKDPNCKFTAIAENNLSIHFKIFPNPSPNIFTIQSSEKISSIEILNLLGEKIYSSQINSTQTEIDLSNQPLGIYFLRTKVKDIVFSKKIIRE